MAELKQNSSVLGKLEVEAAGASNPFYIKGWTGSAEYDLLKILDQPSGNILDIKRQSGTSIFTISTSGTTIGGSYVLPHVAPNEGQVLTRATGAGVGAVSWQDNVADAGTIGNAPVSISGLGSGNLLQYNGTSWVNVTPVVASTPDLDDVTDEGSTTDNSLTVGGLTTRLTSVTSGEVDAIVIQTTDTIETNDLLGLLVWVAPNGVTNVDYAKIYTKVTDSGTSTEDAALTLKSRRAGTEEIGLEVHGKEVTVAEAYTLPTADGTVGQVLKTDGSGNISFATAGGTSALNDLTDVDTTGVADGDGIRYDGTDWHAGKWGVGVEDQTVPANDSTVTTTSRVIELDTEVAAGQVFSVTTLDLTDGDGNRLERCQITTVDVGMGPSTSVLQEKYGSFYIKRDNGSAVDPKLFFSSQYAPGGTTAAIGITGAPSNTYCLNLPSSTSSFATGQALTVKSGSSQAEIDLELSDITLDTATDAGATTTNSITTGSQVINNSAEFVPGLQINYTGSSFSEPQGIFINADNAGDDDAMPIVAWTGKDSANNSQKWAAFTTVVLDDTTTTEDASLELGSMRAGTFEVGLQVSGKEVTFADEFTFPVADGTNGQTLVTNGAGAVSWGAVQTQTFSKAGKATLTTPSFYWYGDSGEGSMEDLQSGILSSFSSTQHAHDVFHNGFASAYDLNSVKVIGWIANSNDSDLLNDDISIELFRVRPTEGTDDGTIVSMGSNTITFNGDSQAMFPVDFTVTSNMPSAGDIFFLTFRSPDAASGVAVKFSLTFIAS